MTTRKPFGKHDVNKPGKKYSSSTSSTSTAESFGKDDSWSFRKPPLPPRSATRTPTAYEKENDSFGSRTKTPRVSNRQRDASNTQAKRVQRDIDAPEKRETSSKTSLQVKLPTKETRGRHAEKDQQLKPADRVAMATGLGSRRIARATKSRRESSLHTRSVADISTSTGSGRKQESSPTGSTSNGSRDQGVQRSHRNVAVSYLHQGAGKRISRVDSASSTAAARNNKLSPPKRKEPNAPEDLDCDSDEQSLGIASSTSNSPSPTGPNGRASRVIENDKNWTLRFPFQQDVGAIVVEPGGEDRLGHREKLQSKPLLRAKSIERLVSSVCERKNGSNRIVTKDMMLRARQEEVDDKDVIAAMLASHRPEEAVLSPSLVGATLEVSSSHSADESELTTRSPEGNRRTERKKTRSGNGKRLTEGRSDSHRQASKRAPSTKYIEAQPSDEETSKRGDNVEEVADAPSRTIIDPWASHPPLPPGWVIRVSKSKNKPYYVHPDYGSSWYPPVVVPSKSKTERAGLNNAQMDQESLPGEYKGRPTEERVQHSAATLRNAASDYINDKELAENQSERNDETDYHHISYDADSEAEDSVFYDTAPHVSEKIPPNQEPLDAVETVVSSAALMSRTRHRESAGVVELHNEVGGRKSPDVPEIDGKLPFGGDIVEDADFGDPGFGDAFADDIRGEDDLVEGSEESQPPSEDETVKRGSDHFDLPSAVENETRMDVYDSSGESQPPSDDETVKRVSSSRRSQHFDLPTAVENETPMDVESDRSSIGADLESENTFGVNETTKNGDQDSVRSLSSSESSTIITQQSRRRRSYGRASPRVRKIDGSLYRPSKRITHPPHPICSLQRLEELTKASKIADTEKTRRSSGKNRRRSGKATDSARKRLRF